MDFKVVWIQQFKSMDKECCKLKSRRKNEQGGNMIKKYNKFLSFIPLII